LHLLWVRQESPLMARPPTAEMIAKGLSDLIERAGSDFGLTDQGRRVLETLMMRAATRG
jgi:hypothetical protein